MKRFLSIAAALTMALAMAVTVSAAAAEGTYSNPANGVLISEHLQGASAYYMSGGEKTISSGYFFGAGYCSEEELSAERSSQYGYCAAVLTNGFGTDLTLESPTIVCDTESYANGVFASAMSKIHVKDGMIMTDNPQGHGADATYMGHVYLDGTVIHTGGSSSGALATDYGGGFITAKNIDATTESGGSPAVYCAGSSIIIVQNSTLRANNCEVVMSAHDHGITVLNDCVSYGETSGLNGHQAMPSPEMSTGSYCFVYGGSLESGSGPLIKQENGRTETSIVGTTLIKDNPEAYAIETAEGGNGILTLNLWYTEVEGNVYCAEGSSLTINLYNGAKLTGEVEGTGNVIINVYDGGEYVGAFETNAAGEGIDSPKIGTHDDYLTTLWAGGMQKWTGSTITTYMNDVLPMITANSAAYDIVEGASEVPFDVNVTDISENGVDPSLIDTGSAAGFGNPGESGGGQTGSGGSEGGQAGPGESGGGPEGSEG
ncbi:MAG: hypothetical protein HUJ76_08265 [Parasporobacterium sp.]|nr:hypothetical protein [Parasporobacterium sp.]